MTPSEITRSALLAAAIGNGQDKQAAPLLAAAGRAALPVLKTVPRFLTKFLGRPATGGVRRFAGQQLGKLPKSWDSTRNLGANLLRSGRKAGRNYDARWGNLSTGGKLTEAMKHPFRTMALPSVAHNLMATGDRMSLAQDAYLDGVARTTAHYRSNPSHLAYTLLADDDSFIKKMRDLPMGNNLARRYYSAADTYAQGGSTGSGATLDLIRNLGSAFAGR